MRLSRQLVLRRDLALPTDREPCSSELIAGGVWDRQSVLPHLYTVSVCTALQW